MSRQGTVNYQLIGIGIGIGVGIDGE